jgi:hypothetical protein
VNEPPKDEAEVIDGVPVLPGEPSGVSAFPAPASRALVGPLAGPVQTVAVAAGGFVAGAAVLGLARRRHGKRVAISGARGARRLGRPLKRSKAIGEIVEIVSTRSLLVDIHLLGPSAGRDS